MITINQFANVNGIFIGSVEFFQFSAIIFTNIRLFTPKLENAPT
jgi:hypothetical protein